MSRTKNWPAPVAGVLGVLVGAGLVGVAFAAPPPSSYGVGRVETCTIDATSGCTVTHGLGVKPDSVTANNSGAAIVYIDPALITATSYRIGFKRSDNANYAAGVVARYTVHYDLPAPVTPAPTTGPTGTTPTVQPTTPPPPPPDTTAPPATTAPASTTPAPTATSPSPSPTTPAGTTLVGAALRIMPGESTAQAIVNRDAEYDGLEVHRIFYPGLPAGWSDAKLATGRPVAVSFKATPADVIAGTYDAQFRAFFSGAPAGRLVYWTYFHEPEDDITRGAFTAAEFRSAYARIAGISHEPGMPGTLRSTLILMDWTADPASGRTWTNYYPGTAAVDVIGWDVYDFAEGSAAPQTLAQHMTGRPTYDITMSAGEQYAIPEIAFNADNSTALAQRPAFIDSAATWLQGRPNVAYVAWFDAQGPAHDQRLLDGPSRARWAALIDAV